MGVVLSSLAVIAVLLGAAGLTLLFEPRLIPEGAEPGPAGPVDFRNEIDLPHTDRWLYPAAPIVALFGVALAVAVIPFGPGLIGSDLGIGVFYFIVVVDFVVLGLSLGGWGANAPNGVDVYYRIVAQLVAYVIPLGLAYIGAIMMAKSMSTITIVERQQGLWYIIPQPVGFALYVVTGLMQCYRAPFLEPFSDRIDRGVFAVYGGWEAILWRITLSGLLFVVAAMGAVLYLGGWLGPVLPGWLWMVIKTYALMALMLWLGRRVAPLSVHRMLSLSWKILTPVGLVNVLLVGGLILLGVGMK